jgi:hypothetical protein
MSKERARRRAERERAAAVEAAARAKAAERERRRGGRTAPRRGPKARGRGRPGGVIARRRRAQNATIALLVIVTQVLAWAAFRSAQASLAVLVLTALATPVLVTLVLDRRGR